jgi:hypothetical protein
MMGMTLCAALWDYYKPGGAGRASVEIVILLSARSQSDSGKVLRAAAQTYKVDTDAIAQKVKQESRWLTMSLQDGRGSHSESLSVVDFPGCTTCHMQS